MDVMDLHIIVLESPFNILLLGTSYNENFESLYLTDSFVNACDSELRTRVAEVV